MGDSPQWKDACMLHMRENVQFAMSRTSKNCLSLQNTKHKKAPTDNIRRQTLFICDIINWWVYGLVSAPFCSSMVFPSFALGFLSARFLLYSILYSWQTTERCCKNYSIKSPCAALLLAAVRVVVWCLLLKHLRKERELGEFLRIVPHCWVLAVLYYHNNKIAALKVPPFSSCPSIL